MHVDPCCLLASLAFSVLYSSPCVLIYLQSFCATDVPNCPGENHLSTTAFVARQSCSRAQLSCLGDGWHSTPPRYFCLPLTKRWPCNFYMIKTLMTIKDWNHKWEGFFEKECRCSSLSKKQNWIILSKMKNKEKSLYFPCIWCIFTEVSYSKPLERSILFL